MATITGNNRANTLTGTAAADTIAGRGGDDRLSGLGGNDRLLGELGNDILDGGAGDDALDGGTGSDIATYAGLGSGIVAENAGYDGGTSGDWSVTSAAGGTDSLVSIEGVVGSRFADRINGGSIADLIRGGGGDDRILGGFLSTGSDTIYGGDGNDIIVAAEETSRWSGGQYPGTGDRFYGGNGNDELRGVDGDDRLFGEAGNDRLSGGPDRDTLTGGSGADTFSYYNIIPDPGDQTFGDTGVDLVADFVRGTDRILFATGDTYDPAARLDSFADLDSNRNGSLDDGDLYVSIERVSFGGAARTSTVIDATEFGDWSADYGEQSLTVFGVTGLRAGDFVADAVA